ncbi:MAG: tetratricopeptide repeat protein, partial [Cyanobacteria bacterium P01_A01_bin.135]
MGLPFLKHRHILLFFVLGVFLAVGVPQQGVTQLATPAAQVQQGVDQYEAGDFQAAIASWQTALAAYQESGNQLNQAIAAENIARAYRRVGNDAEALPYWQQTAALYAQLQRPAKLGRMLTEKAQTYTSLGQYSQAAGLLCAVASDGPGHDQPPCRADSAIGLARQEGDGLGEAAALGSLGEVYRLQGRSEWAEATLSQSLEKARATNQGTYQAAANMSLGSLHLQRARASDRRAAGALQRGDDAAALRQQA